MSKKSIPLPSLPNLRKTIKSMDAEWDAKATERLFSFTDKNGEKRFYSDRATCIAEQRVLGMAKHSRPDAYRLFAPDELIRRVSGDVTQPKRGDVLKAYVDGSFRHTRIKSTSYGAFLLCGNKAAEYACAIADDTNVYNSLGGELTAAVVAIKVAIGLGYKNIEVYHDCNGVSIFEEGSEQQPKKDGKSYWLYEQYEAFLQCARKQINILFVHVKGHSLDMGNEHANYLATIMSQRLMQDRKAAQAKAQTNKFSKENFKKNFKVSFSPKTDAERRQIKMSKNMLRKFKDKTNIGFDLTFATIEQSLLLSGIKESRNLDDDEMRFLRLVMSGANGTSTMCRTMRHGADFVKKTRKSLGKKLNVDTQSGDMGIFKHVLVMLNKEVWAAEAK